MEHECHVHKLASIGRLAGGIAHDFNNLLGIIMLRSSGMLAKLVQGDADGRGASLDPELIRESLAEIVNVSRYASRLTQQLLSLSRERPPAPERVDLRAVIGDLTGILAGALGENVELIARVDDVAPFVEGDRGQLDQVVLNLVLNARDAMQDGGQIRVTVLPLSRTSHAPPDDLDPSGDYVVLEVTDTGVGMDESAQQHIFEPYFTTKEQGTGLGLSTVREIVRQCRGAITVESSLGHGSTITLFIPRTNERAGFSGIRAYDSCHERL